jgi:3-deoxy-D-manno-octulosonic-acid transferase
VAHLADQVAALLADGPARDTMGRAGQAFVARHRGATARTVTLVARVWAERTDAEALVRS